MSQEILNDLNNIKRLVDSLISKVGLHNESRPDEHKLLSDDRPAQRDKIVLKVKSLPVSMIGETPQITDEWPEAISSRQLINDQDKSEQTFRALQIVSSIKIVSPKPSTDYQSLLGKKILDFGCGNGYISSALQKRSKQPVVAYDISNNVACNNESVTYTTDLQQVNENAPYDFIMLHDVIDHIVDKPNSPIRHDTVLSYLSSLLSDDGIIYMKVHPWTSRHGGHAYTTVNKAYVHLVYTADEMHQLGIKPEYNIKINRPQAMYEKWISNADLHVIDKKITSEKVDNYMQVLIDRIVNVTWNGSINQQQALKIMTIQFIDYYLSKKIVKHT